MAGLSQKQSEMSVRSLLFRDSVFYKAGLLRVWEIPINTFEGECVLGIYGVAAT